MIDYDRDLAMSRHARELAAWDAALNPPPVMDELPADIPFEEITHRAAERMPPRSDDSFYGSSLTVPIYPGKIFSHHSGIYVDNYMYNKTW